jgi:hypothetical protein
VDISIYTPGSTAGLPLSILRSFAPPSEGSDAGATRDRTPRPSRPPRLVGIAADPLKSREHILLSAILDAAWSRGNSLDLAGLIGAIQKPPLKRSAYSTSRPFIRRRTGSSSRWRVNNLLASPGFGVWLEGEALDVQRLLFTPEGKAAHLGHLDRAPQRCRAHVRT